MLASLLSYIRYGKGATKGKVASLASVIEEVLENIGIDKTNADLHISLDDIIWIKGDPVLIGQVFQNLVSNAFKFCKNDRPFNINFEAVHIDDGKVQISVTDNGIGIELRCADKVFDIFYRLHDDEEYDGTGIGLSICKKIVTDHGGTIWVDKNHTGGTRVMFTLELGDAAPQKRGDYTQMSDLPMALAPV
jgi:signal transduction histidine kinase